MFFKINLVCFILFQSTSAFCNLSCSEYLSSDKDIAVHNYLPIGQTEFKDYHQFAQALTEGFRISTEEQFKYVKYYIQHYLGNGSGFAFEQNIDANGLITEISADEMRKLILLSISPVIVPQFSERVFVNPMQGLSFKDSASGDKSYLYNQFTKSPYFRLRALSLFERVFQKLMGISDRKIFGSVNQILKAFSKQKDHQMLFTLTGQDHHSQGGILLTLINEARLGPSSKTQRVAILNTVSRIPNHLLDSVFLALYEIFHEEGILLMIPASYSSSADYIQFSDKGKYVPPLVLSEQMVSLTNVNLSDKDKKLNRFYLVNGVNQSNGSPQSSANSLTHFTSRSFNTFETFAPENFGLTHIYTELITNLQIDDGLFEDRLAHFTEECISRKRSISDCNEILSLLLQNSNFNFEARLSFLKAYLFIKANDTQNITWSDYSLKYFDEYRPLIFAFSEDEIPSVMEAIAKPENVRFRYQTEIYDRLVYGMHRRLDFETTHLLFGDKFPINPLDKRPLVTRSPVGELLETSYSQKIVENDLQYIEALLKAGLHPTRGLAIAMGQVLMSEQSAKVSREMIQLFLKYGADINFKLNTVMFSITFADGGAAGFGGLGPGDSFVAIAIEKGRLDLVDLFINSGAEKDRMISIYDWKTDQTTKYTFIEYALELKHTDIADYLSRLN